MTRGIVIALAHALGTGACGKGGEMPAATRESGIEVTPP
jgi:hypothetical protein